jgi:DNA-binding NarL/FixJ family response regulator
VTGPLRVLVVDDHPVVLAGLTAMIAADPGLEVCAAARSVAEVVALANDMDPDVCVLDLQLPDGDGIDLGASAKRRWPGTRVVVLTMSADPGGVVRSLGTGLDGYLLKDSDPHELLAAIHSVATGATVLGRGASAPVVAATAAVPDIGPLASLDARDREILALLAQGLTTSQVANRVFLAPKTIRNRISAMLTKLGVTTREEAVDLARAAGIG